MTCGVIGYGQFGRVLVELAQVAGDEVRAFDPVAAVPDALRAPSLEAVAATAQLIWIAVPLPHVGSVLNALRPVLRPHHVVADVCSVKVQPMRLLSEVLGAELPWAGVHPLLGPDGLRRGGSRPAIICADSRHPQAAVMAGDWLRRAHCQVIALDAAAHDQLMARTQAVAFFICLALKRAGLANDTEGLTYSATVMHNLAESIGGEPQHLVDTILTDNPFSNQVRSTLIEQLEVLDALLAERETSRAGPPDKSLLAIRERIDRLDRRLLVVLRHRADLMRHVAAAKSALGKPVRDPVRETGVFESRRALAGDLGLDQVFVDGVFRAILDYSCALQERELQGRPPPG